MKIQLLASAVLALALAACGSSGGGGSSSPTSVTPPTGGGSLVNGTVRATTTLTFQIPAINAASTTQANKRRAASISPGTNNLSIYDNGTALVKDIAPTNGNTPATGNSPQTFTASNGTTISFTNTQSGDYYTFVATITTTPGAHTFGVVLEGSLNVDYAILSEGSTASLNLVQGTNPGATVVLNGVIASAYFQCAHGSIPTGGTCPSSDYDATTNTYTISVTPADRDAFPIPYQNIGGVIPFDNIDGFNVVETDASAGGTAPILQITQPTDTTHPGNAITDGNSGAYYIAANGSITYGNDFQVKCLNPGTATIALQLLGAASIAPVNGQSYQTYDPANPPGGETTFQGPNYPNSGVVAMGDKTSNPKGGNLSNNATVTCSPQNNATFNLTIE